MIVVLSVSSKAQDVELLQFSARDGYEFLQDNFDDTNLLFFGITANMTIKDSSTVIDINAGTSNIWNYIYTTSDIDTMIIIMVMKTDFGYFSMNVGEFEMWEFEDRYAINDNWIDSPDLALNVKNNTELINFWMDNEDKIASLYVSLEGTPIENEEQFPDNIWTIQISLTGSTIENANCIYNAADGVLFSCEYPTTSVLAKANPFNKIAYPNPSNGQVNLTNHFTGYVNVIVINSAGQRVKTINTNSNNGIELDLSDLPNGNYNVITIQNNKFDAIKVNIQK